VLDTDTLSYRDLQECFFQIHDPSTRDRQGNDVGASYRSAIRSGSGNLNRGYEWNFRLNTA
jgi:peptide-methionine (S)-S-oxide reductase